MSHKKRWNGHENKEKAQHATSKSSALLHLLEMSSDYFFFKIYTVIFAVTSHMVTVQVEHLQTTITNYSMLKQNL